MLVRRRCLSVEEEEERGDGGGDGDGDGDGVGRVFVYANIAKSVLEERGQGGRLLSKRDLSL